MHNPAKGWLCILIEEVNTVAMIIIKQHKLKGSMFKRDHYFDNALIESFWGTLKNKLVYHQDYKTRFEAISDITKYIELDYNRTRIQKGLGCRSPRQV